MKIFNDKFYENPDENAFLNWRTDAPIFSSLYEVGAGFLSSSLITLQSIIINKNEGAEADRIIFPIMFNLWHGIELMFKSGILIIREINNQSNLKDIKGHEIRDLYNEFKNALNSLNLTKPQKDLSSLVELLDEFDAENVNFDAFRYPYDSKWNEQFYNKPQNNIVENKCINLFALSDKCSEIIDTLPRIVKYFEDAIFGDGNNKSYICDDSYESYIKDDPFEESDYDKDEDPIKIILRALRLTM